MANQYATASVEVLGTRHAYVCDYCQTFAAFNVFDGSQPMYACGKHLTRAVNETATKKG